MGDPGPGPERDPEPEPCGDPERHLAGEAIERGRRVLVAPRDRGRLVHIVARRERGVRETPESTCVTPEDGLPGDAWGKRPRNDEAQLTIMRADVAALIANGQSTTLFGDNLLVDLDLSVANLPVGSRLQVGGAVLEVTPKPHRGCAKFRQRFGADALRLTADERGRELRLRGVYARVVTGGAIARGDAIAVLGRGAEALPGAVR